MLQESQLDETYLLKPLDEICLEVTTENIVAIVYQIRLFNFVTLCLICDIRVVMQTE